MHVDWKTFIAITCTLIWRHSVLLLLDPLTILYGLKTLVFAKEGLHVLVMPAVSLQMRFAEDICDEGDDETLKRW